MSSTEQRTPSEEFEAESKGPSSGLLAEFWHFLKHNKKWWLLPILITLLGLGLLVLLSTSAVAPFI